VINYFHVASAVLATAYVGALKHPFGHALEVRRVAARYHHNAGHLAAGRKGGTGPESNN
jgi:hypothetical protein